VTYLPGIVVFLLTLGDIQRGEADLLNSLPLVDLSIIRDENSVLFWVVVILQLSIAAGLLFAGRLAEVALS
jgi:hypothetical protein